MTSYDDPNDFFDVDAAMADLVMLANSPEFDELTPEMQDLVRQAQAASVPVEEIKATVARLIQAAYEEDTDLRQLADRAADSPAASSVIVGLSIRAASLAERLAMANETLGMPADIEMIIDPQG